MIQRLLSPVFRLAGKPKLQLIPLAVVPPAPARNVQPGRAPPSMTAHRGSFVRAMNSTNQFSS